MGKEESSQTLFHLIFIFSKMNHYGSTAGAGVDFSRTAQTPPSLCPCGFGATALWQAKTTAGAVRVGKDEGSASKLIKEGCRKG